MKQIIPFKKELPFKTKVSEITSISLEREINVLDEGIVTGAFHISGDYKMNEGSINREKFSFDLPFDITLDPRYDIATVKADIEDFYYDIVNEDALKVSVDLFVEAEYLPEEKTFVEEEPLAAEEKAITEETLEVEVGERDEEGSDERKEGELDEREESLSESERVLSGETSKDEEEVREEITLEPSVKYEEKVKEELPVAREEVSDITGDLFSNLDDTETYTTYYVYIVKEEDTIDKILAKYSITKEDLESYNDITDIKPGDKVIIPKTRGE